MNDEPMVTGEDEPMVPRADEPIVRLEGVSSFTPGFRPTFQPQEYPGQEHRLDPPPEYNHLPLPNGARELYKPAGKLKGKKAIITGGDSGIGRSIAVLFAMECAESLIVYLPEDEKDASETSLMCDQYGGACFMLATDLTRAENCMLAVNEAMEHLKGIDIVVNNHAFQRMVPDIQELDETQWVHTFNTNIHPFFYLSKYALKYMPPGSTIINNASINAYVGRADLLDYTASKGAVVSFTRGLSNQLISKGIRVNAVAPGPVWTPLAASTLTPEALKTFTSPIGRPSQPSEIATVFVFLASNDSSSISGQTIHVNGGTVVNG